MGSAEEGYVELPVACTLSAAEGSSRVQRWEALAALFLIEGEATPEGVRLRYRRTEEAGAELEELARLERDCCGWARWGVDASEETLVLEVSADGEGAATVRSMFGMTA